MGATVQTVVEQFDGESWHLSESLIFPVPNAEQDHRGYSETDCPFEDQNYAVFAFIGGYRNYFDLTPIAEDRCLPEDHQSVETVGFGGHTVMESRYAGIFPDDIDYAWVTAAELLNFDYEQSFEDRRDYDGMGYMVEKGKGRQTTYRELLGENFFNDLEVLRSLENPDHTRIVFAFSSV